MWGLGREDLQTGFVLEIAEKLRHEFAQAEVAMLQLIGEHLIVAIAHHAIGATKFIFRGDFWDMPTIPDAVNEIRVELCT